VENTGLNIDLFKSDKKVLEEVLIELDHEEKLSLNLNTNTQSTSSSINESDAAITDRPLNIKNCQLGKFGAQRSGKDQFLDISKAFMNIKRNLAYTVKLEFNEYLDGNGSLEEHIDTTFIKYMKHTLKIETKRAPKSTHKNLLFPPQQAKKYALCFSIVARAVQSFATREILSRGYKDVCFTHMVHGSFAEVLQRMTKKWNLWSSEEKKKMVEETIPECLVIMVNNHGEIPEREFDR